MKDKFDRLIEIAKENAEFPPEQPSTLISEIERIKEIIEEGFDRRVELDGYPKSLGTSPAWFREKVTGATSFASMAVDPSQRESYEPVQIIDNTIHYALLASSRFESW